MTNEMMVFLIISFNAVTSGWLFLLHLKEKSLAVYRAAEIHDKIRASDLLTRNCKQSIDNEIKIMKELHMTEPHIKEYVNNIVRPLELVGERNLAATEKLGDEVSELKTAQAQTNVLLEQLVKNTEGKS